MDFSFLALVWGFAGWVAACGYYADFQGISRKTSKELWLLTSVLAIWFLPLGFAGLAVVAIITKGFKHGFKVPFTK